MTETIDPDTGLAAVPAGHFWRVSEFKRGSYKFHLQLFRTRRFRKPVVEREAWSLFNHESDLRLESFSALERWNEYLVSCAEASKSPILGDYPPNRAPSAEIEE